MDGRERDENRRGADGPGNDGPGNDGPGNDGPGNGEHGAGGRVVRNLRLRRAVLGVLLRRSRPMSVSEIVADLRAAGIRTNPRLAKGEHRVVADLLNYQRSLGRVRRVSRGVYEVVPERLSRSMRWRCVQAARVESTP